MEQILPEELLAEPDDLDSLKKLINRWIYASFKQDSIYQYVAEEFSLEKKAKKVFAIYENLLSKS
jgi:glycosyltransferase involved in cell wall biosynthesis